MDHKDIDFGDMLVCWLVRFQERAFEFDGVRFMGSVAGNLVRICLFL